MSAFPFKWWLILAVCMIGTLVWLLVVYWSAGRDVSMKQEKPFE